MTPEGNMAPPRSWWSRNWKWAVPVGCLGMLASCGCLFFGAGVWFFSSMKNSPAYTQAMSVAESDDEVKATLGSPLKTEFWEQQSSIKYENGQSTASFKIPLNGPKAHGVLHVEAYKSGDTWQYPVLQVEVPGKEPIDLRDRVGGGPQRELAPPTPDAPPQAGEEEEPPAGDDADGKDDKQDINL